MPESGTTTYESPEVTFFSAQALNSITVTMSGGGYTPSVPTILVYKTDKRIRTTADGEEAPDLINGDYAKQSIINLNPLWFVPDSDIFEEPATLFHEFREMAYGLSFSSSDMSDVLQAMILRFQNGISTNYSDSRLTQAVQARTETTTYINAFKNKLSELIRNHDGRIADLQFDDNHRENSELYVFAQTSIPHLSYNFNNLFNGLMLAVHDMWATEIRVKNYRVQNNIFRGTMSFTLYDHFGLDPSDMAPLDSQGDPQFNATLSGMRSWFILQHYSYYNEQYKSFVTKMDIDIPITVSLQ